MRCHTRRVSKKRRRKAPAPKSESAPELIAHAKGHGGGAHPEPYQWPALTGLRGLAAFAVFCQHTYLLTGKPAVGPVLSWLFAMGGTGVDVFFTLSAFLLTVPFVVATLDATPAPNLREYGRRRLLRIVPAYYAQIAILLGLTALGSVQGWVWNAPTFGSVLAHLTFYLDAWPLVFPQVPSWWTLPVEMCFYLFLPLFARCLRPGRWWWLLLGIVASLAYRYLLMHAGSGLRPGMQITWGDQFPGRLHEFLVGMLAAYAYVRLKAAGRLPAGRKTDALALAAIAIFLALPALGYPITGDAYLGLASTNPVLQAWHLYASLAVALLLVMLAADAPMLAKVFSWAPLRGLGLISYSLYLWNFTVLMAVRNSLGYEIARSDFWNFYGYGLLVSLLVALASWWLIEQPAQRWARANRAGLPVRNRSALSRPTLSTSSSR
jgi:peptidoglycan/LPS O-acetylase OafA/YrhL